ncbi:MAG: CHRD domain-containing protein [Ardenticatenaceae bacterium]
MKRRIDLKRFGALFALLLCFGMLYVLTHTATQAAPPDFDSDKDSTLEESKFQFEQVDVDSVTDLSKESAIYIVRLQDAPLATYRGGIRGLAGTSPAATGKRKVDARSSESVAYLSYLDQKRAQAITEVDRALGRSIEVVYEYKASLNGFAAKMTAAEAAKVAKLPSVQHIEPDMEFELHTDAGPAWLGAPAVWGQNPQDLPFEAPLSGLNEVPPVTDTMASGMGMFSYNAMTHELHYDIEVSDIMSITAAHIHQAAAGANGGAIHTLYNGTGDFGPDHPISGMVTLSPDQHQALMDGNLYVNVHTVAHGPGEIRGQIMPLDIFHAVPFESDLSGANEVSPVTDTMASGMGSFSYDVTSGELHYDIEVSNIMSITKAHIHSGTVGVNGPGLYWLYDATGTNGPGGEFGPDDPIHGTIMVSDTHKAQLWNGDLYVNIHTTNHPSGELRGQIKMNGTMGENVIVGVIDTGIDPWNPSFADMGDDGYDHTNPRGEGNYVGVCNTENISPTGEISPYDGTFPCNDKLIGAWGYGSVNGGTPRDSNGHGSHTAGTAAGNVVMNPSIETPSATFTATMISGVAPHANVIAYAACCTGSALAAARDQVVLDGVDVVNYSIGSTAATADPWNSSFAQQWLNVRDAGIFVATSAGNAGPGDATVGSPGDLPWMTTVGASSHNRAFLNSVIIDGGALEIHGLGLTGPLTTAAEIVFSSDYVISPTTADDARLCGPDAFPAGTFTGQIVVCERGAYGRVAKGQSAAAGGAGGYILAQPDEFGGGPGAVAADAHVVPGVHIDYYTYQELRTYMITTTAGTSVTATITGATLDINDSHADVMASFSSRGPNRGMLPDLIVPNVTAPGRSIWAAYHHGEEDGDYTYNVIQGTSMSSPHVAGAGALMVALHRNWTPAQIESALMTTARDTVLNDDGINVATPFAQGSGHVDLRKAAHAGLVLDVTKDEFEGANPAQDGDPKTLNIASMANSQCVGSCSWKRTVQNTLPYAQTWEASLVIADGVTMTGMVDPMTFTVPFAGAQELNVTVDVSDLPLDEWAFAKVMLTPISPTHPVPAAHLPIAVQSSAGRLPQAIEIDTRRNAGSMMVEGFEAIEITDLTVEPKGLAIAELSEFELFQDPTNGDMYDDLSQVFWMTTTVPADSYSLIAEILASESPDIDIAVGMDSDGDGQPDASEQVCLSAGSSWTEFCEVPSPDAGLWWVVVQNWSESANPPDAVTLATAVVPNADNGNLLVDGPDALPAGEEFAVRVFWDEAEMEAGDRLYGAISLGSDAMNAGNIGTIPVTLNRHRDDVTKHAPPMAHAGETLTYTIMVHPNIMDEDLGYMLTDTIPTGMTYVEGSASASAGTVMVDNGLLTWNGTQIAPSRRYLVSTSLDDASCIMPFANSGAYVNLEAFGFLANAGISGPGPWQDTGYGGGPYAFFNNPTGTNLYFTDEGYVSLDIDSVLGGPYANAPIPTAGLPEALLAMIWGNDMDIVYENGAGVNNRGVTTGIQLATGGVPYAKLLEFDGIQMAGDPSSQIDFELMIREAIADDAGLYEIVFAYDNLTGDFTNLSVGTIGVENHDGTQGTQYAHNDDNLLTLQNGMAVCFDWAVPQLEPVAISFQVTVDEDASDVITNTVHHNTDNPGSMEDMASASTFVAVHGVELSDDMAMTGDAGTMVTYTLEITNTGNVTDMFTLTVSSDWTTELSTDTVGLDAGESMMLTAMVSIPADAMGHESDMAMVNAMSHHDQSVTDTVKLTTSVNAIYGVELAHDMAMTDSVGSTVTYTLQITNTGNITDSFDLEVDSDWSPMSDTLEMAAGESAMVMVPISIPADAQDDDQDMATVTATSMGDANQSASVSLTTTAKIDEDDDGVDSETEDAAPNNGDGNSDGTDDSEQDNVASLPNQEDEDGDAGQYVTLQSPSSTTLVNVQASPAPMTIPMGVELFPQGVFDFVINGVDMGATVQVTITLHSDNESVDGYYKQDNDGNWADFAGAMITDDGQGHTLIVLTLTDGGAGDADGVANGTIVDPGAPATREPTAISLASLEGQPATLWQALWIALLLLIGVSSAGYFYALRRKRA